MQIRTIGPHIVGATGLVVLGLAVAATVVGVQVEEPGSAATTHTAPIVAPTPAVPPEHDVICAGLRARLDLAVRNHPSDAAAARIASNTLLQMHC